MSIKREEIEAQYTELKKKCQENIALSGRLMKQIASLRVTIDQQQGGLGSFKVVLALFDENALLREKNKQEALDDDKALVQKLVKTEITAQNQIDESRSLEFEEMKRKALGSKENEVPDARYPGIDVTLT